MADKTITNPNGAQGYTDLQTTLFSVCAPVLASAAVPAKRVVAFGTDGSVSTALTNGTASLNLGIVVNAIASGSTGQAVVLGIAEDIPCAGAVAAGDLLKASATTAGYVSATATPAAGEVIGVALAASSSNTADVWVTPGKGLS